MTYGDCYCCARKLRGPGKEIWTADPQMQWVGPECYRKIVAAGAAGYVGNLWPEPRLFATEQMALEYRAKEG